MRNKLLIGTALLAAGIGLASCEKTPSGEPGAETEKQSGRATSERQQAQQPVREEQVTPQQRSEARKLPDHLPSSDRAENEQESKQAQPEAEQNQPTSGQNAQVQDQNNKAEGEGQSPQDQSTSQRGTSAQSDRGALQEKQVQPNQPQQSQVQRSEPQQNEQNGKGTAGLTVNLSRDQIRQAQSVLKQRGFDVGVIDGIFGPRTRKAVIAFQQKQGLQANGEMDERTVTALGLTHASGQRDSQGPGSTTTGHGGSGSP
jgi:Putative peptidoglycan binding domain